MKPDQFAAIGIAATGYVNYLTKKSISIIKIESSPYQMLICWYDVYFRSPFIEADFVKVFYNDSTETFQTQDSFTSKKPTDGRYCNLQVDTNPKSTW